MLLPRHGILIVGCGVPPFWIFFKQIKLRRNDIKYLKAPQSQDEPNEYQDQVHSASQSELNPDLFPPIG